MTTIKDAPVVEQLIGTEKFPISDGSGKPVTATIQQIIDKCSGVPIVDSEDKLDTNAPQGSLGVVAYNTKKSVSIRDLYQPTMDDVDMYNGVIHNPEKLSKVDKLEVTFPEGVIHAEGILGMSLIPRTFGEQNIKILVIEIASDNGVVRGIGFAVLSSGQERYELCQYDENGVPSINQENIDILNNLLTTDDWCYLSMPGSDFIITEDQFNILDKFFKVLSGSQDTTLYINKPEGYKNILEPESVINKITGDEKVLITNDGKLSTATVTQILDNTNTKLNNTNTRINQLENYIYDNGVYAVDVSGKLIDYNLADATALGVALVAGGHQFMIAKSNATDGSDQFQYWGQQLRDKDVTNIANISSGGGYIGEGKEYETDFTTWSSGPVLDFNGKENTAAIINGYTEHGVSMDTGDMCSVLNTFNASDTYNDWYIPACGQLALMYLNMTEINAALEKIGGFALTSYYYWSSSENSSSNAWLVNFIDGWVFVDVKNSSRHVRFVRDIPSISKRLSNLESNTYTKSEIDNMIISTLNTEV